MLPHFTLIIIILCRCRARAVPLMLLYSLIVRGHGASLMS
jgi:hypothetical protein